MVKLEPKKFLKTILNWFYNNLSHISSLTKYLWAFTQLKTFRGPLHLRESWTHTANWIWWHFISWNCGFEDNSPFLPTTGNITAENYFMLSLKENDAISSVRTSNTNFWELLPCFHWNFLYWVYKRPRSSPTSPSNDVDNFEQVLWDRRPVSSILSGETENYTRFIQQTTILWLIKFDISKCKLSRFPKCY